MCRTKVRHSATHDLTSLPQWKSPWQDVRAAVPQSQSRDRSANLSVRAAFDRGRKLRTWMTPHCNPRNQCTCRCLPYFTNAYLVQLITFIVTPNTKLSKSHRFVPLRNKLRRRISGDDYLQPGFVEQFESKNPLRQPTPTPCRPFHSRHVANGGNQ
jgi:hypothetical protein